MIPARYCASEVASVAIAADTFGACVAREPRDFVKRSVATGLELMARTSSTRLAYRSASGLLLMGDLLGVLGRGAPRVTASAVLEM
jgi:hypothetical protein